MHMVNNMQTTRTSEVNQADCHFCENTSFTVSVNLQHDCIETEECAIHIQHSLLTFSDERSVQLKENVLNDFVC